MEHSDETTPLLARKKEDSNVKRIVPRRLVVVEPLLVLYVFSGFHMEVLQEQYLLRRVGYDMGIDYDHLNSTHNETCGRNPNDTAYIQRELVQTQAAHWELYIDLVIFVPSCLSKVVFGAMSDQRGRRLCFILPPIGSIFQAALLWCTIHFHLPIQCLFLSALYALSGTSDLIVIGAFSYIADTTSKKWLAVKMTIIDVLISLIGGLSSLGLGYLIKFSGYALPLVLAICGKVISLLYAYFFIQETIPKTENVADTNPKENRKRSPGKQFTWKDLLASFKLFTHDDGTDRRWKICFLSSSYFLYELYRSTDILTLYQQNSPFCWNSVMLGCYGMAHTILNTVGTLSGISFKYWLAEHWLMVVGKVSSILEYTALLLATNTITMFIVPVAGCMAILARPMMRAIMSRYVRLDEQASLFAAMYCITSVCKLASSSLVSTIYAATLQWYEQFVFVLGILVKVLSLFIVLLFIYKTRNERMGSAQKQKQEDIENTEENENYSIQ